MKKTIATIFIALAAVVGISAQSAKSQNEGVIAYSFIRQNIELDNQTPTFNEDTDSHGVSVSYSRYTKGGNGKVGVLGLTGEVAANFDRNEASVATVMGGAILKARNNSVVQPYVRALAGVGRQHISRHNITNTTDASFAYDFGAGVDWAFKKRSRYAFRTSVDYVNTGFNGQRQPAIRLGLGLVL